jgi:outer membrane receptor protein involved in Fe transport
MDCVRVTAGARVDVAVMDVTDDPAKLSSLGTLSTPANPISLADILGSGQFDHTYALWAAYVTGRYNINDHWAADLAVGYAERPPTLTELYVAQSFMFVLQNGLNTLTGDPRLDPERLCQIDLGLRYDDGVIRGRIGGFHAWAWDYITFENLGVVHGPPAGQVEQVQLKYVNTDLATFTGVEAYGECDLTGWLTPFATLSYVEGRDQTRNGHFATKGAVPGSPSTIDPALPRGAYSGVAGSPQEPLPGIAPLESRLGFRVHPAAERTPWSVELAARLVTQQDRVAPSLLESPSPGFTLWDLRGYWRPRPRLLLVAGVENFTNRAYREHLDFRSPNGLQMFQPGRNLYTGCEWSY